MSQSFRLIAIVCALAAIAASNVLSKQIERCQPSQAILQFAKNGRTIEVKIQDPHGSDCTLRESEYMSKKYFSEPKIELSYLGKNYALPTECTDNVEIDISTARAELSQVGVGVSIYGRSVDKKSADRILFYLINDKVICAEKPP